MKGITVRFERDGSIDRGNAAKHGVGFDEARRVSGDRTLSSAKPAKRRLWRGSCMKKASAPRARTVTRTIAQIENRGISKAERQRLKRVAALHDDQIDTSDIPKMKNGAGWVRAHERPEHPLHLHRVLSRLLSIRLPEPDMAERR
jgi:hypothetical protein